VITWDEHKRLRNLADHGVDLDDLDGFFDGELLTWKMCVRLTEKSDFRASVFLKGCRCSSSGHLVAETISRMSFRLVER
jgi:uncharacterized DUF497 family protein